MVYRRDLKMRKGKIAAQCCHASVGALLRYSNRETPMQVGLDGPMEIWMRAGSAKIVLSTEGEEDLLTIQQLAQRCGIPNCLITDSGLTEFKAVSYTHLTLPTILLV